MPTYTFRKPSDGTQVIKRLTFAEYAAVKTGTQVVTDPSGEALELVFVPSQVGFVLKDGVSGGWTSKADKENKYRRARSVEMTRREKDHVFKSRLVPNYKGQEAHSWTDVRDHVRSTSGAAAAATYEPLVAKERSKS